MVRVPRLFTSAYLSPGNVGREETAVQRNARRVCGREQHLDFLDDLVRRTLRLSHRYYGAILLTSVECGGKTKPPLQRRRCYRVHVTSRARLSLCTCSRSHVRSIAIERSVTLMISVLFKIFLIIECIPFEIPFAAKRYPVNTNCNQLIMTVPLTNSKSTLLTKFHAWNDYTTV